MVFSGSGDLTNVNDSLEQHNIRVSSLTKNHTSNLEIVERWIMYVGVTRKVENSDECYLLAFDPDRDEFACVLSIANCGGDSDAKLKYSARFLMLKHNRHTNGILRNNYGFPEIGRLIAICSPHSFIPKPNEEGRFLVWIVNQSIDWNSTSSISIVEETASSGANGGVYTGEMSFRTLRSIVHSILINADKGNESVPTSMYGAFGLGQFAPAQLSSAGTEKYYGYGYMGALKEDVSATATTIKVNLFLKNFDSNYPIIPGHDDVGATIYLIGCVPIEYQDELYDISVGSIESKQENFNGVIRTESYRIEKGLVQKETSGGTDHSWYAQYSIEDTVQTAFSAKNTIVLVVPDTGKMYLSNIGENIAIPDSQRISISQTSAIDPKVVTKTDTDIFRNSIKLEKKGEIDSKKTISSFLHSIDEKSGIDKGYYSAIMERKHLELKSGDTISENNSEVSQAIRVVPAQYISMPFNIEHYQFGNPVHGKPGTPDKSANVNYGINDFPPFVENYGAIQLQLNTNITFNRDMHMWMYPVIGLFARYDEIGEGAANFDSSRIADNGSAELLGYWYLGYDDVDYHNPPTTADGKDDIDDPSHFWSMRKNTYLYN